MESQTTEKVEEEASTRIDMINQKRRKKKKNKDSNVLRSKEVSNSWQSSLNLQASLLGLPLVLRVSKNFE